MPILREGFTELDRKAFKPTIYWNLVTGMRTLMEHVEEYGSLARFLEADRKMVLDTLRGNEVVDEKLGAVFKRLWSVSNDLFCDER